MFYVHCDHMYVTLEEYYLYKSLHIVMWFDELDDKFINFINVFKIDRKIGTKYQHSPFYKGTLLLNDLSADIQFSRDIFEFKKLIARKYMIYENLLQTKV